MSSFENFINTELPRRPTLLTFEITGYQGDPNSGGAPAIVQNSPKGTFYLRNFDGELWRKKSPSSTSWEVVGSATGSSTETTLSFPVNHDLVGAAIIPSNSLFTKQDDIDSFLTTSGTTAFKYIQDCLDAIPLVIRHNVTLSLSAGVHRPRATDSTFDYPFRLVTHVHHNAALTVQGAPAASYPLFDATVPALTVSSITGAPNPSLVFAGTPFAGKDLRGALVRLSTGQIAVVHDHTSSALFVTSNLSPSPAGGTASLVRPASFIRNSLDDISQFSSLGSFSVGATGTAGSNFYNLRFVGIQFDSFFDKDIGNFGLTFSVEGGQPIMEFFNCMVDGDYISANYARDADGRFFQVNATGGTYAFTGCGLRASLGDANEPIYISDNGKCTFFISDSVFYGHPRVCINCNGAASIQLLQTSIQVKSAALAGDQDGAAIRLAHPESLFLPFDFSGGLLNRIDNSLNLLVNACGIFMTNGAQMPSAFGIGAIDIRNSLGAAVRVGHRCSINYAGEVGITSGGGNSDVGLHVEGPIASVLLNSGTTVSGSAGDTRIDGEVKSYASLLSSRAPTSQPGGTLTFIRVDEVEDDTATGSGTLTYVSIVNTLTYAAPGDTPSASITLVTGGGVFSLRSSSGKSIRIYVKATPALPGSNTSQAFTISRAAKTSRSVNGGLNIVDKQS